MKRFIVGVVALLLVLGLSNAGARAAVPASAMTIQDTASTKSYIALHELNDTVAIQKASAVNAGEDAVVAEVRSGCSNVLEAAPRKPKVHQIGPVIYFFTETFA